MPILHLLPSTLAPDFPSEVRTASVYLSHIKRECRTRFACPESHLPSTKREFDNTFNGYFRYFDTAIEGNDQQSMLQNLARVRLPSGGRTFSKKAVQVIALAGLNAFAKVRQTFNPMATRYNMCWGIAFIEPVGPRVRATSRRMATDRCTLQLTTTELDEMEGYLTSNDWTRFWTMIGILYGRVRWNNTIAASYNARRPQVAAVREAINRQESVTQPAPRTNQSDSRDRPTSPLAVEYANSERDTESIPADQIISILQQNPNLPGDIRDTIFELIMQFQIERNGN